MTASARLIYQYREKIEVGFQRAVAEHKLTEGACNDHSLELIVSTILDTRKEAF